ncbi:6-bladed beta-propeller [Anaeromyxobacter terrae]|uniref:6-bladed beta-propeller n=1 Tax=Anaeromyxobacter terrae TaxID=2925406 RepID=UPI001F5678CC|nr:6-bladed beta-propeller [Anaeromyxobacter sp. SG22]
MTPAAARLGALAACAALACAHAPRAAPSQLPDLRWPEGPAAPRARLARLLPDPQAQAPIAPAWRRALDAVLGLERRAPDAGLRRPFGVLAVDGEETLVADPDLARVVRVGGRGTQRTVECKGRAWSAPFALARAPSGELLVADAGAAVVVRISPDGRCAELGAGRLERPTGVAATADRIYVADPPRHEVVALSAAGEVVARMGGRGAGDGQLSFPTAVAVAPDGTLLVVDALNFRISRFSPDGRWLGAFGEAGDEGGALARPKGIAVDREGRVYVSDAQRDVVLVFSPAGALEYALGASGEGPGRFVHPAGLAVAGNRLLVADSLNGRVQVFELIGEAP